MEKTKKQIVLPSTVERYKLIRQAVNQRLGTMPVMMAYTYVAKEFGLTEETVRKIIRKINKWDIVPTKTWFYYYLCTRVRKYRNAGVWLFDTARISKGN